MMQYDKLPSGEVSSSKLMGVIYVPLTDAKAQWPSAGLTNNKWTQVEIIK